MVYHASVAQRCCRCCDSETRNTGTGFLEIGENRDENHDEESVLIDAEGSSGTPKTDASRSRSGNSFCLGLTFAVLVGLFGGSVNVPSELTKSYGETPTQLGDNAFVWYRHIMHGADRTHRLFNVIDRDADFGGLHWRALTLPGLLSGTIWNLGNVCSVHANDIISFAIAQPLMQCALLVSGILGIFVFKEIAGRANIITFLPA